MLERIDKIKSPGPLQLLNMRGTHLAALLMATWLACFVTVGMALYFGWRWGYGAGIVDGQREATARQADLHGSLAEALKARKPPVVAFDPRLEALIKAGSGTPSVSTFVVLPGHKSPKPQVIQVKGEAVALPKNLEVTVKNIKELLPKAPAPVPAPPPAKPPEKKPEPKVEAKPKKEKDELLPPPGKTEAWLKEHGYK